MDRETLVGKFAQTVGLEKAEEVLTQAEAELNVTGRTAYDRQDVQDLCEVIQYDTEGYLAQVANEIRVHEQAEQRFVALLGNVPDPAVVVTFPESRPVVDAINDAFVETFGFGHEEAEGRTLSDLILPADVDAAAAESQWLATTEASGREVRRVTAAGDERTFLFRSVLITRATGEVEGYGIYTDITERKRREQKLHSQNERLERILDMVSHDLRNPLTVASGRTDLLLERVEDEDARDELATIQSSHERMESLIDDLLQLARRGPLADETQSVTLADVGRSAWEQVETERATLVVETDDQRIEAVPQRLRELFENLYRNAVEHGTTSEESASVRQDAVEPAAEDDLDSSGQAAESGDGLVVRVGTLADAGRPGFYVADDGSGIDAADVDAVLERGFTTAEDGTGLGLSIVDTIAGSHGWEVAVTESERGGARFEFSW